MIDFDRGRHREKRLAHIEKWVRLLTDEVESDREDVAAAWIGILAMQIKLDDRITGDGPSEGRYAARRQLAEALSYRSRKV